MSFLPKCRDEAVMLTPKVGEREILCAWVTQSCGLFTNRGEVAEKPNAVHHPNSEPPQAALKQGLPGAHFLPAPSGRCQCFPAMNRAGQLPQIMGCVSEVLTPAMSTTVAQKPLRKLEVIHLHG